MIMESEYKAIKLRTLWTWIFFNVMLVMERSDSKKLSTKRSVTLIQRQDYSASYESKNLEYLESSSQYDADFPENLRLKAAEELLVMFGLKVPRNLGNFHTNKPPKYMVDLYKAVANSDGSTKFPDRINVETVRSVPNKDPSCPNRCEFNLDLLGKQEMITDAEFHVFLHRPRSSTSSPTTYIIKIFQMVSTGNVRKLKRVLIAARHLSSQTSGWQIFSFLTTITSWVKNKDRSLDLSIELTKRNGDVIHLRPTSKDKQPIIVTFIKDLVLPKKYILTTELTPKRNNPSRIKRTKIVKKLRHIRDVGESDFGKLGSKKKEYKRKNVTLLTKPLNGTKTRKVVSDSQLPEKTSKTQSNKLLLDEDSKNHQYSSHSPALSSFSSFSPSSSALKICQRYPLYVDFEEMGWSGWIIFPQGYNAYHCKGKCSFPLSKRLNPSSHATVQSIMHVLGLGGQPVELPCCAPDTLYDITLLYFDQNDNAVLQRYKDMVAGTCACR